MKIKLISDVHVEFHRDGGMHYCQTLPTDDVDLLIIAGDFGTLYTMDTTLEVLLDRFREVIYVPGNHEYYGSNVKHVNDHMRTLAAQNSNLHVLINDTTVVNGRKFVGSTAWYNVNENVIEMRKFSNDFNMISDMNFDTLQTLHDKCQMFLSDHVKQDTIVVTHFLPLEESVSQQWKGNPSNCFFVTDCSKLVQSREPWVWCHGHTHVAKDYQYGKTRVICNPLGYPREVGVGFNESLTFDV